MDSRAKLIEECAEWVAIAGPRDRRSMEELSSLMKKLVDALAGDPNEGPARASATALTAYLATGAGDPAQALNAVSQAITQLQNPAAPASGSSVERDAELIDLMAAFLEETTDGLSRADEILMKGEGQAIEDAAINELFRVFHSIKGTAGFIDLTDVIATAHTTETLLDLARDHRVKLEGQPLELVFESTSLMRTLLKEVRGALEGSTAIAHVAEVDSQVARLKEVIAKVPKQDEAPSAPAVTAPVPAPSAPAPSAPAPSMPAFEIFPPPSIAAAAPSAPAPSAPNPSAPNASAPRPSAPGAEGEHRIRETLKVDVQRVDSVVEMIGELIIVESMVANAPELAAVTSLKLRNYLGQLTKISRDLQDVAMRMRMVPVRTVFQKMARLARDLSHKTGKKVVLVTAGEDTEMDRSMVERIEEPLVHMVRNAVDHGVESAEQRARSGKAEVATLRLSAMHEGGNVVIELADDGKGIDTKAVLEKAKSKGLVQPNEQLSDQEIQALIFAPGFSTAAQVTELSGRGVGMDVVKRNVESLRGRIVVDSTWGKGTSVRLVLPLTLAIIDGMLIACGSERFIVPSLSIVESLRPTAQMLCSLGGSEEFVDVRGELLPLLRLGTLFSISDAVTDPTNGLVVVAESAGRKVALMADDVLAQQQVVIKPLGSGVGEAENFSGAAILSDGRAGLILNVDRLLSLTHRTSTRTRRESPTRAEARP
ncbi:MAG: chemotaxis protein CheA [Myxococcaceae bacterium]